MFMISSGHRSTVGTSRQHSRGLTLIELLVVLVIVGVLSAVAIPSYLSQVRRARYAGALSDMGAMQRALLLHLAGEGQYPQNSQQGQIPTTVVPFYADEWPLTGPYNALYDYEEWQVGPTGCYIQITFHGENQQRDSPGSTDVVPEGGVARINDDLILSLGRQPGDRCPDPP